MGSLSSPDYVRGFDPLDVPASDSPRRAWTNPFNPCLPDANSRTCPRYVPFTYPPFNPDVPIFLVKN